MEAEHRRAQRQLEALATDARSEVREARNQMLAARDLAQYHASVLLPQRVKILEETQLHYNMMLKGVYDLLQAKQSEVRAETAYVEAWRDYWLARTELERAVGGRLPDARDGQAPEGEGRGPMMTRRTYLASLLGAGGSALASAKRADSATVAAAGAGRPYTPVTTPGGSTLPFVMKSGVKEFHLIAEPVKREFASGMVVNCWGYNGQTPGPTLEAVEGDRLRILVENRLPEHTTIHWHGIFTPNGMDGVGGLLQPQIKPGETYVYEFTLRQHGTFMYHPHADETVQMALGMMGFFVVHPGQPQPDRPSVDRDFCLFPHMWFVDPGTMTPNPSVMLDFNTFTFNGRAFPDTEPMVVRLGQRVRIRVANVSMTSHPLLIHGHRFWVVETDGGQIPRSAWWPETTIDIAAGTTRAVEFVADAPGDWPFHCHKSHHAMNAMNHDLPKPIGMKDAEVERKIRALVPGYMAMGHDGMAEHATHVEHMQGLKNTLPMMTGAGPFGNIEMGGMFTLIKIREGIKSYEDPGWFDHPKGTVAWKLGEAAPEKPAAHRHQEE